MKTMFHAFAGAALLALLVLPLSCNTPNSPGDTAKPPRNLLKEAANGIELKYAAGESAQKVKTDIELPKKAADFAITWTSDKDTVITADGTVKRQEKDEQVTLTAKVTAADGNTAEKKFVVTVYGKSQETVDSELSKVPALPQVVIAGTDTVPLTLSSLQSGVTGTWTATPTGIINTDNGTVTSPAQKTTVTLTLTLTKNGASAEKSFSVTVYPTGTSLTLAELLETVSIPSTVEENTALPVTCAGGTISWESNTPAITITPQGTLTLIQDLTAQTAALTATLTKDGNQAKKVFTVTIPPLTQAENRDTQHGLVTVTTFTFEGTVLTVECDSSKESRKWRYNTNIDAGKKTMQLTQTHEWENGTWFTIDELEQLELEEIRNYPKIFTAFCTKMSELSQKTKVTFTEFYTAWRMVFVRNSEEEVFPEFISLLQSQQGGGHTLPSTLAEFKNLPEDKQSELIKAAIDADRKRRLRKAGLPETASWTEYAAKLNETSAADIAERIARLHEEFKEMKKSVLYSYTVSKSGSGYNLMCKQPYNPNLTWYAQSAGERYAGTTYSIKIRNGANSKHFNLDINGQCGYRAECSEDGSTFTARRDDHGPGGSASSYPENITGTIQDNHDGTLLVTIQGQSASDTLEFQGFTL